MKDARNHGIDEPALLSLNKFDHLISSATRGCLFILDQSGLTIRATNPTVFAVLGVPEEALLGTSFLDLVHYDDVATVKDMVCRNLFSDKGCIYL